MSDEQTQGAGYQVSESVVSNEPAQQQEAIDNNTQVARQPQNNRPAGYEPIDEITATPEQVKERLTYLYSQVKTGERTTKELKKIAADQSRLIGELTQGFNGVVNHLQDKSNIDTEANLKNQLQQAFERGDNAAYIDIQTKLIDLGVQKKVQSVTRQQPVQQHQQQPRTYQDASHIASDALDNGELSPQEYQATEMWQNEKDASGNLMRPWAYATSSMHIQAVKEAQAVWANPKFTTNEQRLAEVDRRMGVQKPNQQQSVMGGNLTTPAKQSRITLSPEIQKFAIRTKFAGSKAKSDAEHIEAYRKQIEKTRQSIGARK